MNDMRLFSLLLLFSALTAIDAVDEKDWETWSTLDAAQRARELPVLMAQVDDPQAGFDVTRMHRLAVALAHDGDRAVSGVEIQGSTIFVTVVDALSPTGQSRQQEALALLTTALARKSGDAWLVTWRTLRGVGLPPTPETLADLPRQLASSTEKTRKQILRTSGIWAGWGSPALSDLLMGWLAVHNQGPAHVDADARAALLLRLYETDPQRGRIRTLEAIAVGDDTIALRGLLHLPDETLPQFDALFRTMLHDELRWNAVCCATRYGSAALLPDVLALYRSKAGGWACELSAGMLRYLMKYDHATGILLVREAMALRQETGCFRSLLPEVLAPFPGDDVDQLIDSFLFDPDDDVARQAINAIALRPNAAVRLRAILAQHGAALPAVVRTDAENRLKNAEHPAGK
ncbi:MAG: hypothetical protein H0X38_04945 [Planctomycetes bacterium]|nr:hypothetical protein [Planctomycetota bacterium]